MVANASRLMLHLDSEPIIQEYQICWMQNVCSCGENMHPNFDKIAIDNENITDLNNEYINFMSP